MTNEDSLAFASIEELATLLAKRKVSPVELTELFLRRIERHKVRILARIHRHACNNSDAEP